MFFEGLVSQFSLHASTLYALLNATLGAASRMVSAADVIVAGTQQQMGPIPQVSLNNVYSAILTFFLVLNPAVLWQKVQPLIYFWKFIGTYLSLVFIFGIVYVFIKQEEFNKKVAARDAEAHARAKGPLSLGQAGSGGQAYGQAPQRSEAGAKKWQRIIDHVSSANPNDWRLAILEADVLLEELLDSMNAQGETLGEKLKSLTTAEMPSIQLAWEGHKVRNQIAHEGADFLLSQHEARRVIALYERVLRQGLYI